jgi:hypothetical protein
MFINFLYLFYDVVSSVVPRIRKEGIVVTYVSCSGLIEDYFANEKYWLLH